MNRVVVLLIGFMSIALSVDLVRAEDKEAMAIVDRAIKAMGGEEKLTKAGTESWKKRTTLYIGESGVYDFVDAVTRQAPDLERVEKELPIPGQSLSLTILRGRKLWLKSARNAESVPEEGVLQYKRRLEIEDAATRLVMLKDQRFVIRMAHSSDVDGQPADQLDVTGALGQDFKLFFDKKTHLPVMALSTSQFLGGPKSELEHHFTNYNDVDGIKKAMRVILSREGKKSLETVITDFKILDKVPTETFDEPK